MIASQQGKFCPKQLLSYRITVKESSSTWEVSGSLTSRQCYELGLVFSCFFSLLLVPLGKNALFFTGRIGSILVFRKINGDSKLKNID